MMSYSAAEIDRVYGLRGEMATKRIAEKPGACACHTRRDGSERSCMRWGMRETNSGQPRAFAIDCSTGQPVRLDDAREDRRDPLGAALRRQAAEAREDASAGPPRGARTHENAATFDQAVTTASGHASGDPLARARAHAAREAEVAAKAGAPVGSRTR